MQVAQQQVAKPTDAQIQSQIQNLRWQEKQTELANAFNRQQVQASNSLQVSRMQLEHEHYMVNYLTTPVCGVLVVFAIVFAVIFLGLRSIQADIQKNRDDNAADVVRAQEIIAANEAGQA